MDLLHGVTWVFAALYALGVVIWGIMSIVQVVKEKPLPVGSTGYGFILSITGLWMALSWLEVI